MKREEEMNNIAWKLMLNRINTLIILKMMVCMGLILKPVNTFAEDHDIYRIETIEGTVFIGFLLEENDNRVVLRSEVLGELIIEKINIKNMRRIDPRRIKDGVYWFENPHATRYLFSTNAIGLKKGQAYYQNIWIFFNNVNVGITDNFSLGGGTIPLFLFGARIIPFWFLPKFSIPIEKGDIHLAAGGMFGGIIGEESAGFGLAYVVSTIGTRDNNLSVGIAYGYSGDRWSERPTINFSGMARIGRNSYLISENWFFPGDEINGIISAGFRWAPEKFAVDFAIIGPLDVEEGFIGIPWLGVTIPFGK
jgi:hypothetical protein